MRRVRTFVAMSLDGYIAGPGDSIDWLFTDQDYGYSEFIAGVDTLILGRRTYETARGFAEWPYAELQVYVFTHAPEQWNDPRVTFTDVPVDVLLRELRGETGKDIWLVGGGELIRGCLERDLVDEFEIAIHPIVLGGGASLFPPGTPRTKLHLRAERHYETGLVTVTYDVERSS